MRARDYTLHSSFEQVPLQKLTELVAECMRRNNIKRASGNTADYRRALHIARREVKTPFDSELKERVYQWVLPKEV